MTFYAGLWTGAVGGGMTYILTLDVQLAAIAGIAATLLLWTGTGMVALAVNAVRRLI